MCSDSVWEVKRGSAFIQTHLCQHEEALVFKPTRPENLDHKEMLLAVQEPGASS